MPQRIMLIAENCGCGSQLSDGSLKDRLRGLPLFSLPQIFHIAEAASSVMFVYSI